MAWYRSNNRKNIFSHILPQLLSSLPSEQSGIPSHIFALLTHCKLLHVNSYNKQPTNEVLSTIYNSYNISLNIFLRLSSKNYNPKILPQFFSSLLSPQSSYPLHWLSISTHFWLSHLNWFVPQVPININDYEYVHIIAC